MVGRRRVSCLIYVHKMEDISNLCHDKKYPDLNILELIPLWLCFRNNGEQNERETIDKRG